jgi:hypothetical protein
MNPGNGTPAAAPEPFVSAKQAAEFLSIGRGFLLSLARRGIAGAYPVSTGEYRRRWIFRISELTAAITWRGSQCP